MTKSSLEHAHRRLTEIALKQADAESLLRDAIDYGIAYLRESGSLDPFPTANAISLARAAQTPLPSGPTLPREVLRELAEIYGPATVRTHSGRYFGFVHGSSFPIGMAAKCLSTIWDQNAPLFALSPATSLLETEVENWLVDLFGLPTGTAAGFVSSTSQSLLTGVFVAREALLGRAGWPSREKGLRHAPRIRVVLGEQCHVTVRRALSMAGFGSEDVNVVAADSQGRFDVTKMPALDDSTLLILQAGNIYTGAFDHFQEIIPLARQAGAWTHVDGAFGLWVAASPTRRSIVRGIEDADSWSADCHKTLNTPFSTGLILCRERDRLRAALSFGASYLERTGERDGMDYSPDMARRCSVAEVWATLKSLGREGLALLVDTLCAAACEIAEGLRRAGYCVVNDVVFNQLSASLETDEATESALRHVQRSRIVWCGGGIWAGRKVIRINVSSWRTSPDDIAATIAAFRLAREAVLRPATGAGDPDRFHDPSPID